VNNAGPINNKFGTEVLNGTASTLTQGTPGFYQLTKAGGGPAFPEYVARSVELASLAASQASIATAPALVNASIIMQSEENNQASGARDPWLWAL
jgi:hypothetical protein